VIANDESIPVQRRHLAVQLEVNHGRVARGHRFAAANRNPGGYVGGADMNMHRGPMLHRVRLAGQYAYARVEALKVMNWRSAWLIDQGTPGMAEASAVKVFGTETVIACYRELLEITRQLGIVRHGQPGALADGLLESAYRLAMVNTFGGGVNEVQRDIIAMAGLGLPRARR